MHTFLYMLCSFFLFISTVQHSHASSNKWDSFSDEKIRTCLSSYGFKNISILYSYNHKKWEMRIIYNPLYEQMIVSNGTSSMFKFKFGFFSRESLPGSLQSHIEDIIHNQLNSSEGGFWSIASILNGAYTIDLFECVKVVEGSGSSQVDTQDTVFEETKQVSKDYSNVDREICDLFKEKTFGKLSLNYEWNGKEYLVHFVHNPMKELLFCHELAQPVRWPLAMTIDSSTYPLSLAKHLKNLVPHDLLTHPDSVIDVANWEKYLRKYPSSLFTSINPTSDNNTHADQEIRDLFKEKIFKKLSLSYQWNDKQYLVHFVYNPMREVLFSPELSKPVQWPFAMTIDEESFPFFLVNYLKSFVPEELLNDPDSQIDLSFFMKNPVSVYQSLQPIVLLHSIENPEIDSEIQVLFRSEHLKRKLLYYELDGCFYSVLLIYNPEKLNLSSKLSFDTWKHGHLSHRVTWNSKIGIFVDKEAPRELIDYISQFYELSWWDNFWNCSIHNGDKLTIDYFEGDWIYKYTPHSWYTFMYNAEPD